MFLTFTTTVILLTIIKDLIDWLIDWLTDWLIDWLKDIKIVISFYGLWSVVRSHEEKLVPCGKNSGLINFQAHSKLLKRNTCKAYLWCLILTPVFLLREEFFLQEYPVLMIEMHRICSKQTSDNSYKISNIPKSL